MESLLIIGGIWFLLCMIDEGLATLFFIFGFFVLVLKLFGVL